MYVLRSPNLWSSLYKSLIELLEPPVLRRKGAVDRRIDDQEHLAPVFGHCNRAILDRCVCKIADGHVPICSIALIPINCENHYTFGQRGCQIKIEAADACARRSNPTF
jgi:hypothetical protein